MYAAGDKIIYGENGVCTVEKVAPLAMSGEEKLYYHLVPLIGSGTYFTPVDSAAFMRPVMSREEAMALLDAIPGIEPAICNDSRFNHVDAFYKELFRKHSCEALVAIIKGLRHRLSDKKTKSSRAESTLKRARDMLQGELSIALEMDLAEAEALLNSRLNS